MNKTIATSSSFQLLLKDNGYELEREDVDLLYNSLSYVYDQLDMDNMDALDRLHKIIEALELALDGDNQND